MTTPVPVGDSTPAPRPTAGATGTHYTHRTWLDEMAVALGHVAGVYRDLQMMDATLHEVQAGQTQVTLVGHCIDTGLALMQQGVRFVDATDARYVPVFEAIRQAGGQHEVTKDKHYHDRD